MGQGLHYWKVYEIGSFFNVLLGAVCDTLTNHYEKEGVFHVDTKHPLPYWFKVFKGARKNGGRHGIKAEGEALGVRFLFRSHAGAYSFSAEGYEDVEHIFYLFLFMVEMYCQKKGFAALGLHNYCCAFSEADSPGISAEHYAVIAGESLGALRERLDLLARDSLLYRGLLERYAIMVYAEKGEARNSEDEDIPAEYIPLCQKFLGDFKRFCVFEDPLLFCVRKNGEQHVYCYGMNAGLFYNTKDSSREFLEAERQNLAGGLAMIPGMAKKTTINKG
jgi:hypothetical protein